MTNQAKGTFDLSMNPIALHHAEQDASHGRMSLDKRFHGDIEATSTGEMLTAMGSVDGSAGYVAIERVSGSLHGRSGNFALLHRGVMNRGEQELSISVVPDSGTGELVGLSGTLTLDHVDGQHVYTLEYSLGEQG